jgi:hypothetical protein
MSAAQIRAGRAGLAAVLLLPAGLLAVLAFSSGGFFPDATAVAVVVVLLALLLRATLAPAAFAGVGPALSIAAAALLGFAVWTLLSGTWSDAPARALLEYNRVLLYAGVLVLLGTVGRTHGRARLLLGGLALAATAVSLAAVATWLLPELLPAGGNLSKERQGWPTSYWNATGLIAGLCVVWGVSLTCDAAQPRLVRVLGAAAAPVGAAAIVFTASRGAAVVALGGVVVAVLAGRTAATLGGLAAAVPGVAGAALVAVGVEGLNVQEPSPAAIAAGERAALALAAMVVATAVLRAALLAADERLGRVRLPRPAVRRGLAAGLAACLVIGFVAAGGPGAVGAAADDFTNDETRSVRGDLAPRERFTRLGNNGRLRHWRVALEDGFTTDRLRGTGAGTYALLWAQEPDRGGRVLDAHSLYVEVLGELGLVGLGLLAAALLALVVGLLVRCRGPARGVWAGLLAGALVWAVHAGVDWDWEMPATTVWVFAAGGLALAAPVAGRRLGDPPRALRIGVGLACLLLAVTPTLVWRSQTRLQDAVNALNAGDCATATDAALDASSAVGVRPEPFEVLSYCNVRAGRFALAQRSIDAALERDPENWELHYAKALVRGAAGLDPRDAAAAALRRNPRGELTRAAVRRFDTDEPRVWRRRALTSPLPVPPPS